MQKKELTLVIGGARSGKSAFAVELARRTGGRVLFLATLRPEDEEMRLRVIRHRGSRPSDWLTLEEPVKVAEALAARGSLEVVLLDCLTLWVSNLLLDSGLEVENGKSEDAGAIEKAVAGSLQALFQWYESHDASLIIVSNEVGSGVVPHYRFGRLFRDLLGEANQRVAARADKVYYLVAGIATEVKAVRAQPEEPSTYDNEA